MVKLAIVVLSNAQADEAVEALLKAGHRVTRLASTGGLLRQGNTTLLVGAEDKHMEEIMDILRQQAPGALIAILPLERYEHF